VGLGTEFAPESMQFEVFPLRIRRLEAKYSYRIQISNGYTAVSSVLLALCAFLFATASQSGDFSAYRRKFLPVKLGA
jgi:hypothetical protein